MNIDKRLRECAAAFFETMKAADKKAETFKELSELFGDVAKAANEVTDPALKIRLNLIAALGDEKLKALKK